MLITPSPTPLASSFKYGGINPCIDNIYTLDKETPEVELSLTGKELFSQFAEITFKE